MSRKDLLPAAGPALNVRQALYRASRDYPGGQTALALSMGVPVEDLCRRVNPVDSRTIKPEWLEEVVALTKDSRLLDALVRPAGAVAFVPQPVPATSETLLALGQLLESEAAFVRSLHEGAGDGRWEPHEVAELCFHGNQVIAAILGIVAGARQAMEGGCHG